MVSSLPSEGNLALSPYVALIRIPREVRVPSPIPCVTHCRRLVGSTSTLGPAAEDKAFVFKTANADASPASVSVSVGGRCRSDPSYLDDR